MSKGYNKSNDLYMKRFTENVQILEPSGGPYIFFQIWFKKNDETVGLQVKTETEIFEAMCFLKRVDTIRYDELM